MGLTLLNANKAKDNNGKYYDPTPNASLIDDPANMGRREPLVLTGHTDTAHQERHDR